MAPRQLAMVIDLDKCIGCQTCTLACKSQWTDRAGREFMYWNHVETRPGRGYPKGWEEAGGGWDGDSLRPGRLPGLREDYGIPASFTYEGTLFHPDGPPLRPQTEMQWGPNWGEDQGAGEFPNSYYFYLPRPPGIGDPVRGAALAKDLDCGSCHTLPGGERAEAAPDLTHAGGHHWPGYLRRSIAAPSDFIVPKPHFAAPGDGGPRVSAMPSFDLSAEAREDLVGYLASLR